MKFLGIAFFILIANICYSQVIISEIQSSNSSTISDNNGEYEDWIELYNPTENEIDIGGLVLKDNVDTWQIPTGKTETLLPPKGYFMLWCDDQEVQGDFHTNFKLSASNGEFLGLYESDSTTEIESVNIPPLSGNQCYVKCAGNWNVSNTPTPLANNECASSVDNAKTDIPIIYPTISNGKITINVQEYTNDYISISVYSMKGAKIFSEENLEPNSTINLSFLKNNLYVIRIQTIKESFFSKIIIISDATDS